ncbi:hypothetical protein, partial [Cohnella fermenti]|uniref:hypothetical protein n=1 Tax=Cohnella fermenti TaxID=2565925 RepID=UPI001B3B26B8
SENFDNMVGLAWCSLFSAPMAFRPDFFPISQFHLLDIAPLGYACSWIQWFIQYMSLTFLI